MEWIGSGVWMQASKERRFVIEIRFDRGWRWVVRILDGRGDAIRVLADGIVSSGCELGEPETCAACGKRFDRAHYDSVKAIRHAMYGDDAIVAIEDAPRKHWFMALSRHRQAGALALLVFGAPFAALRVLGGVGIDLLMRPIMRWIDQHERPGHARDDDG